MLEQSSGVIHSAKHMRSLICRLGFACLVLLGASFSVGEAATPAVGRDVVEFAISFPKEKGYQKVVFGLYEEDAPATVANFKKLAKKRYYKGLRFHRAFPNSLVQTGDPLSRHGPRELAGTGGPGYTVPAEIRLPHKEGSIAMARLPDGVNPAKASNGGQFYVALEPMPKLDGKYTVFGEVLEGMDVLKRISNLRTNSNDFPLEKVIIRRVKVRPQVVQEAP